MSLRPRAAGAPAATGSRLATVLTAGLSVSARAKTSVAAATEALQNGAKVQDLLAAGFTVRALVAVDANRPPGQPPLVSLGDFGGQ